MKKSKIETADTRKRIVSAASKILLSQGLATTGIAEIMSAAGLTQGGFYRHFESKEQLIAEANSAASEQLLEMLIEAAAGKPPREALDTMVCLYLSQTYEASALCSLASLGSELRHSDNNVRAVAMDGYQSLIGFVTAQLEQLNIPDHTSIAESIVSTMVGAVTIARLAVEPTTAKTILDNARAVVNVLLSTSQIPNAEA